MQNVRCQIASTYSSFQCPCSAMIFPVRYMDKCCKYCRLQLNTKCKLHPLDGRPAVCPGGQGQDGAEVQKANSESAGKKRAAAKLLYTESFKYYQSTFSYFLFPYRSSTVNFRKDST
jgi:hypothetical protein